MAKVMIVGKNKRPGFTHTLLGDALREAGVDAYNCTANFTPARTRSDCKVLLNHGVGRTPQWIDSVPPGALLLNDAQTVEISANKVRMHQHMRANGIPSLAFTTSEEDAIRWSLDGKTLVVRHRLASHSGKGIEIVRPGHDMPRAALYTELFEGENVREYRVYIVDKVAVDIRQKQRYNTERLKQHGIDPTDPIKKVVRTNRNGWVFARNFKSGTEQDIRRINGLAEQCARVFGLGYGAVDIIMDHADGRMAVIEPNTNIAVYDSRVMANIVNAIKELV